MARPEGRLTGRIALITGASRGIGAAVARRYAAEGAHVILVARTTGGLEEVDDEIRAACGEDAAATLVPLDLSDMDQVDRLGHAVAERFGRLDILVGNAGLLGTLSPLHQVEPDDWDRVLAVNLTANWRLVRMFDTPLRASDAGRAIMVTSSASRGAAYWGPYAITKAALDAMVKVWAAETAKTSLRVNALNPGSTKTAMRAQAYPGEDPMALKTPDDIAEVFVELAEPACTRHGEIVRAQ